MLRFPTKVLLLAAVLCFAAGFSLAQVCSEWLWSNPLPQGNRRFFLFVLGLLAGCRSRGSPFRLQSRIQARERCGNVLGQDRAGDSAAVPHQFEQLDCIFTEHGEAAHLAIEFH